MKILGIGAAAKVGRGRELPLLTGASSLLRTNPAVLDDEAQPRKRPARRNPSGMNDRRRYGGGSLSLIIGCGISAVKLILIDIS